MSMTSTQHEIICKLQAEIAQLTEQRDAALAKCAEMRSVLSIVERLAPGYDWNSDPSKLTLIIGHCFQMDCGKGWRSPEQFEQAVKPTIELITHMIIALGFLSPAVCSNEWAWRDKFKEELARLEKLVKEAK